MSQRLWGGRCGPRSPPKLGHRESRSIHSTLGIHGQHRARLLALSHPYSTVRRSDHRVFVLCVSDRIEICDLVLFSLSNTLIGSRHSCAPALPRSSAGRRRLPPRHPRTLAIRTNRTLTHKIYVPPAHFSNSYQTLTHIKYMPLPRAAPPLRPRTDTTH